MNKLTKTAFGILGLTGLFGASSCTDDSNEIGSGLIRGEVVIDIDSSFVASGKSIPAPTFDSKNRALLLGHLNVPEYGDLNCSFVSRLMPSSNLMIPDTIKTEDISGLRLKFMIANGAFTGDSLAPQQVEIYRLIKQLPEDINNNFNPEGYYEPTPLATRNYTASAMGMTKDVYNLNYRSINIDLPIESARSVYEQYRSNPDIFQWPELLSQHFPGIFARNTFGDGLVVDIGNTEFTLYYQYIRQVSKVENDVAVKVDSVFTDSTTIFTISPEVLSSNNISLLPSESIKARVAAGEAILQSPGGYNLEMTFPGREIVERYRNADFNLAVVNSLSFELPVRSVPNDYEIKTAPYLLMIKSSKVEEFFAGNNVPQGNIGEEKDADAFWASYNSDRGSYSFNALRPYILDLLSKDTIEDEDVTFSLIPVEIRTENTGSTYNPQVMVSSCLPYITRPTMGIANFDNAKIRFTFSRQKLD